MSVDVTKDIEAARDGMRLLVAEVRRLDEEMDGVKDDAENISRVVRRAGSVAARAVALLTTLQAHLPELVRADCEAHHEEGESVGRQAAEAAAQVERDAWTEGLQAGNTIGAPDASL